VLFLGIDMLKDTFSGAAADFRLPHWEGAIGIVAMVLVGILMTVLMQASAASLVIAFSAAQSGLVSIEAAAAVVIGANVGTTVTALLAAIGATSNAKRAAAAHILFNVLTGIVALLLLPWLLGLLGSVRELLGLDSAPAAKLALFHTAFNILGVLLIWPLADWLTGFRSRASGVPRKTRQNRVTSTRRSSPCPPGLDALAREVRHLGKLSLATVRAATAESPLPGHGPMHNRQVVARLNASIADFIVQLTRSSMAPDSARRLPELRAWRAITKRPPNWPPRPVKQWPKPAGRQPAMHRPAHPRLCTELARPARPPKRQPMSTAGRQPIGPPRRPTMRSRRTGWKPGQRHHPGNRDGCPSARCQRPASRPRTTRQGSPASGGRR
jgi:phosphate:Na+ symporter